MLPAGTVVSTGGNVDDVRGGKASPTAGWYADPQDEAHLRWWDGSTWTSARRPREASPPEPVGVAHAASPPPPTGSPIEAFREGDALTAVANQVAAVEAGSPRRRPTWVPRLVILVAVALMGFAFALSTVDAAGPVLYRVVDETERNPLGSSIALRVSGTNELTNPVLIGRGDRALTRIASGRWSLNEPMRLIVESPYPGDGTLETELDLRVAGASFLNDGWNVVVELVVTDTAIEIRVSQPRTRGLLLDRTSAFSTMVRRARVTGSRSSSDPAHSDSTSTTVHGTIEIPASRASLERERSGSGARTDFGG